MDQTQNSDSISTSGVTPDTSVSTVRTFIRRLRILRVYHTPEEYDDDRNGRVRDVLDDTEDTDEQKRLAERKGRRVRLFLVLKGDEVRTPTIRATGFMVEDLINVGAFYDFSGKWRSHERYGRIFCFTDFHPSLPDKEDMVREFLSNRNFFKGLPSDVVDRIVDKLGDNALHIIRKDGEKALKGIKGVGIKFSRKITEVVRGFNGINALYNTLFRLGVSPHGIFDVCFNNRNETVRNILENPYQMSREHPTALPYSTADRIFVEHSLSDAGCEDPFAAPLRIRSGIMEAFSRATIEGHTFLHEGEAVRNATDVLMVNPVFAVTGIPDPDRDVIEPLVTQMLSDMIDDGTLTGVQGMDDRHVYLPKLRNAELQSAERLMAIAGAQLPPDVESTLPTLMLVDGKGEDSFEYSFEQMEAISAAMTNMFVVITGGPGTGKTTIMSEIVRRHLEAGRTVSLAAPTAKAADRMSAVTGLPACTVQRLLEYRPKIGPYHNSERPIESDVVVVDEFSMVDVELFENLVSAIEPGTFLVAIGDVNQLPSVGPGNVLYDIIASGIFAVRRLSLIFRQGEGSSIPELADSINRGRPLPPPRNPRTAGFVYDWCGQEDINRRIGNIMAKAISEYYVSNINQIRVVTPLKTGPFGSEKMSEMLRDTFRTDYDKEFRKMAQKYGNVQKEEYDEDGNLKAADSIRFRISDEGRTKVFHVGDRVIQNVNSYETGIMNGDEGFIVSIDAIKRTIFVEFESGGLVYTEEDVNNARLETSYCTTVHKCQGSEYPCVIFVLPPASSGMVDRRLIYTAVTRAKKAVFIVGSRDAFMKGVGREGGEVRNSGLKDALLDVSSESCIGSVNDGFYNVYVNGKKIPIFDLKEPESDSDTEEDDVSTAF